jgi:undecaprenyl pyrophosphate phosphatase UppP
LLYLAIPTMVGAFAYDSKNRAMLMQSPQASSRLTVVSFVTAIIVVKTFLTYVPARFHPCSPGGARHRRHARSGRAGDA